MPGGETMVPSPTRILFSARFRSSWLRAHSSLNRRVVVKEFRWFLVLLTLAMLECPARGEEKRPLDRIDDKLRTAEILRSVDREEIQKCLEEQADILLSEETSIDAKRRIREDFLRILSRDPAPSSQFKEKFIGLLADTFKSRLKDGEAAGTLTMLLILYDLRESLPPSLLGANGLALGLQNPSPAVRYWTAKTIAKKQVTIMALPTARAAVVAALQKAAIEEDNDPVLREIYLALDFGPTVIGKVPFGEEIAGAFVSILEARGERYLQGTVTASEADLTALATMKRVAKETKVLNGGEVRKRYVTALVRMLYRAVEGYLRESEDQGPRRDTMLLRRTLLLTRAVEDELQEVTNLAQSKSIGVYAKMQTGSAAAGIAQRDAWCGWPPDKQGVLNGEPYRLPLGAGFAEVAGKPVETSPSTTSR